MNLYPPWNVVYERGKHLEIRNAIGERVADFLDGSDLESAEAMSCSTHIVELVNASTDGTGDMVAAYETLRRWQTKTKTWEGRVQSFKVRCFNAEDRCSRERARAENAQNQVGLLEGQLDRAKAEIEILTRDLAEAHRECNQAEAHVATLQARRAV